MDIEKIAPVGKRCLVKVIESASESKYGIVLENASNTATTPIVGVVLKAGASSDFKEGQKLFWRRYALDELKFITEGGEQTIFLVEDEEVLAVINE